MHLLSTTNVVVIFATIVLTVQVLAVPISKRGARFVEEQALGSNSPNSQSESESESVLSDPVMTDLYSPDYSDASNPFYKHFTREYLEETQNTVNQHSRNNDVIDDTEQDKERKQCIQDYAKQSLLLAAMNYPTWAKENAETFKKNFCNVGPGVPFSSPGIFLTECSFCMAQAQIRYDNCTATTTSTSTSASASTSTSTPTSSADTSFPTTPTPATLTPSSSSSSSSLSTSSSAFSSSSSSSSTSCQETYDESTRLCALAREDAYFVYGSSGLVRHSFTRCLLHRSEWYCRLTFAFKVAMLGDCSASALNVALSNLSPSDLLSMDHRNLPQSIYDFTAKLYNLE